MRRYLVAAVVGLLVTAGVLVAVLRSSHAAAARGPVHTAKAHASLHSFWSDDAPRLDAAHLSALRRQDTLVPGVPQATRMIGASYTPRSGEVHRLGPGGMTLAWVHGSEVCEVEGPGGGCVAPQPGPLELSAEDPDVVGKGQPARAVGLAVDGVVDVKVTLDDGRSAHAAPVDNFYSIDLPPDAMPPFPMTIEATMSDGSTYSTHVPRR